jgi:hypothetical protein
MSTTTEVLTPVEFIDGRHYKREDTNRHPSGVNGSKFRQCRWLVQEAVANGATALVTGASVMSPQHAMVALEARRHGLPSTHVVGGTTYESALKNPSILTAVRQGGQLDIIGVGYNPALQSRVKAIAAETGAEIIHYGITTAPHATDDEVERFHRLGAEQVQNLPGGLETLILPFGSGNSATSVLYGLGMHPAPPKRVVLVGIGPTRYTWMMGRLEQIEHQIGHELNRMNLDYHDLHKSGEAVYSQKIKWVSDGILLHPNYEAKVARWADRNPDRVPGWHERDGSAALWIIGGPL